MCRTDQQVRVPGTSGHPYLGLTSRRTRGRASVAILTYDSPRDAPAAGHQWPSSNPLKICAHADSSTGGCCGNVNGGCTCVPAIWDGCQVGVRWVSDECQMGVRWVSDGCQMGVRWVSDG